jgi:hypothetical protein
MIHLTKTISVCSSFDKTLHHRTAIMFPILSKTSRIRWGHASFKSPVLSIHIGVSITEGIEYRSAPIRQRGPIGHTFTGAGKAGAICSADRSLFHFEEAREFVGASMRISIAALSSAIHEKSRTMTTLSPLKNSHIRMVEPESICGALFKS